MDENRSRGSPRLKFSKEELENAALSRPIQKAEKAADKYDAAQKKLKRHRVRLTLENRESDTASSTDAQQNMHVEEPSAHQAEREPGIQSDPSAPAVQNTRQKPKPEKAAAEKPSASGSKPGIEPSISAAGPEAIHPDTATTSAKKKALRLKFEETQKKKPSQLTHPVQKAVRTAGDQLHRQAKDANEDDNVAVTAVLQTDEKAETALQMGEHAYHAHKMRPYKRLEKAEKRLDRANIRALEKQAQQEHPQFTSNPYSRWQQKRAIRREYAAARRGTGGRTVQNTAKTAEKATEKVSDAAGKTVEVIRRHPTILLILALGAMLLIVMSSLQACTPLAQSVLESLVIGTYPAEEEDVRAAERVYAEKERQLKDEMAGFIEIDRQDLNGCVLHEVAQVFTAVIGFSCLCIHAGKHTGFGGDADIGPGCFIGRLIGNFRGFLLRHLRFSRKIFRGLSAFLRILCRFRIRRRLILHGLLRFIRRGFLFGSRLFCRIGFRQGLVFHQISRKLSLFRIGFDRFLCCSAYRLIFCRRSIHRLFHNLWICLSSRIASVHQEQTHHANRSLSLSYREEADILDVLIQQEFLVQILH